MMMKNLSDIGHFERLYQQDADPWHLKQRWYEQRKRALILACLPQQRYRSAYEPGCGNGMMTVALAQRCDQLIASDGAPTAVQLTKERVLQEAPHASVNVEQHALPGQWPQQQFDLILMSEIAYYLAIPDFRELQAKAVASLAPGGTLILCHWRGVFEDRAQSTEAVHGAFHDDPMLHSLCRYEDAEILIEVWSNSA